MIIVTHLVAAMFGAFVGILALALCRINTP